MTRLVFVIPFGRNEEEEAKSRGYLSHVLVELDDGRLYPVFFYDIVRLQQDLDEEAKHGRAFVADPGMIVLSEVTLATMELAAQKLCDERYFDKLRPVQREQIAAANPLIWPPLKSGKGLENGTLATAG